MHCLMCNTYTYICAVYAILRSTCIVPADAKVSRFKGHYSTSAAKCFKATDARRAICMVSEDRKCIEVFGLPHIDSRLTIAERIMQMRDATRRRVLGAVESAVEQAYGARRRCLNTYGIADADASVGFDMALTLSVVLECSPDDSEDVLAFQDLMDVPYACLEEAMRDMASRSLPPKTVVIAVRPVIVGRLWMAESLATQASPFGNCDPVRPSTRQTFYQKAQYVTGVHENTCASTLMCIVGAVCFSRPAERRPLAGHYRCVAERCAGGIVLVAGRQETPRCTYCRREMAHLSLLDVDEVEQSHAVYVPAWNASIDVLCRGACSDMAVGNAVLITGYAHMRFAKTNSVVLEASHVSRVLPAAPSTLVCACDSESLALFLGKHLSRLRRSVRVLQLLVMLLGIPDRCSSQSRIAILTAGSPWHHRAVCDLLGHGVPCYPIVGHVHALMPARERDAVVSRSAATLFENTVSGTHACDILLDWRDDGEAAEHVLSGASSTGSDRAVFSGPAIGKCPISWTAQARVCFQQYYVAFRGHACRLNDGSDAPMHHPGRQASVLRAMAERAAAMLQVPASTVSLIGACSVRLMHPSICNSHPSIADSVCVTEEAVAVAAALGEVLLSQRYGGRSVLRGAPADPEAAAQVVPPSPISDGAEALLDGGLDPAMAARIESIRSALCI